ncbi:MAG: alpha/beta hydrolase [Pseudomonadota bacterium]
MPGLIGDAAPAAAHPAPNGVQFFTADDGLRLAYDDAGDGIPVICLAGLTRNMTDFDFVRPYLLDRCRVIRMDYRGRGRSDFDSNYQNYNVLREAQDVIGLMDHLGLEQAAILGTSRGGIISMILAGSHKERLLGVCLNDIGPLIEPEGLAYIFGYLGVTPKYQTYEEAADGMIEANAKRFPGVSRDRWRAHAEHLWREKPDGLALRYDKLLRRILMEQSASDTMPDMWLLFEALKGVPIALIHGANSDLLSQETAAEMQRRRPDMPYARVADRGHVPFLDEPEALNLISQFLEGLSPAPKIDSAAAQ